MVRPVFKKRRGFVRNYKRRAFAGRGRLTGSKVARCIETKHVDMIWGASQTLGHTAGFDFQWVLDPLQFLVQGSLPENFNGECIWLSGIKVDMLFTVPAATNSGWILTVDVFKCQLEQALSSATWTETNSAAAAALQQRDFYFFDLTMPPTDQADNTLSRVSNNYSSKHLLSRKLYMNPTNATAQQFKRFSVYLKLNQMFRWRTDAAGSLTTPSNYGVNGNYVFVLRYVSSDHASTGVAQPSLVVARGSKTTVYFKDP